VDLKRILITLSLLTTPCTIGNRPIDVQVAQCEQHTMDSLGRQTTAQNDIIM
jgi:hypothetical protein